MELNNCILKDQEQVAGDISFELQEIDTLSNKKQVEGIHTITVGCSAVFSLICC